MSIPEGMQTLAARLASFESTKQKGKKRASTKTKKVASNWALDAPTPEELAQAGFFLTATTTSPDNVTCFCCHKSLDEWEEGDDPFRVHLQFAPECAWAVTMAVERGVILKDDDHDPLAEEFVEMRTATFGNAWPHESKKAWTPKIKKLVDAGWHYFPTPEEEDQTKCAYCSLCVSGWEPKDKPLEEHKRRAPECPFFHLTQLHKKTRPKKSRASKASRMSAISIATWTKEPSVIDDGNMNLDENVNPDDSIMTTATDVTTASTATTATTATRKSTRTKKSTAKATRGKQKQEPELEDTMEFEEEENFSIIHSPEITKAMKNRKRSSAAMLDDEEEEIIPPPKKRGARGRSTTARPTTPPALEPSPKLSQEKTREPSPSPVAEAAVEPQAEVSEELEDEPELMPETGIEVQEQVHAAEKLEEHDDSDPKIDETPAIDPEPETLSMPKRGAKGRNARGSTASRAASGKRGRKATGPRKASGRKASDASNASTIKPDEPAQPMELDDAAIEAQLEADLDRPLSDEEVVDPVVEQQPEVEEQREPVQPEAVQPEPQLEPELEPEPELQPEPEQLEIEKPARGKKSAAKKSAPRTASRKISQPAIQPKKLPVMADDSEEDELAETYQPKTASKAEQLFSNPYESQIDDTQLSDDESAGNAIKTVAKKSGKKSSVAPVPAPKPKRGRPPKKAVQKTEEPIESSEDGIPAEAERQRNSAHEVPTESRFSSSFEEVPSILDDVAPVKAEESPVSKKNTIPKKTTKVTKPAKAPAATKKGKGKKASAILTMPEEDAKPPKVKEAVATSTPAPVSYRQATPKQEHAPTPSPPRSAPGAFPSPTPSPQSSAGSNAENEPPSSRPSKTRQPLAALSPDQHAQRVPLGSAGPTTPTHEASQIYEDEDANSGTTPQWALQSGFPWRPVDIENVFLPSPGGKEKRWFGPKSGEHDASGRNGGLSDNAVSTPLSASKDVRDSVKKKRAVASAKSAEERARVERVLGMAAVISESEKDMTVEQWIRANAERGETRLKEKCEQVVSAFEREGIRAMKALEGLVVNEWA